MKATRHSSALLEVEGAKEGSWVGAKEGIRARPDTDNTRLHRIAHVQSLGCPKAAPWHLFKRLVLSLAPLCGGWTPESGK